MRIKSDIVTYLCKKLSKILEIFKYKCVLIITIREKGRDCISKYKLLAVSLELSSFPSFSKDPSLLKK